ncbi:MAG: UvrD-helicase domain-containing protein [Aquabacterium sp.]|jgi:DNA helicase-2/ATP-dependent DNA helicase PcrA|uniref:UvrD-helicase domain-containing protein n=1 Tax=Aquabacterium sp. TaxID=1872578 RepID=UPI001B533BA1|nr:UvrD-helicase domain-containing protein [Aquabacterium sp.]MBP7132707.1 UvrD-helicase domain-containing protein [Aquabacterium sp.]MDQ5925373.1 ATP-dependent helicase UvrD/PcrA [Pseudomonadota bacterium]
MIEHSTTSGLFPSAAPAGHSPLLAGLNPEQLAAVTAPPGPALILAGAGSGKTRVLTTRIAWLLQTGQVSPSGIMAVTFTNKAAKEMQARLSAMLPLNTRAMWIGTFHGLCNRFLRAHAQLAGLPQAFQILDTQDQLSAVKRIIKALKFDEEKCVPKQTSYFIAHAKDAGQRPKDLTPRDELGRMQQMVYQAYEDQCQREGVVDFAELMLRTYEIMRDHPEVRDHYQRRFKHILVDEFQDTNRLQYMWLKMFAGSPALTGNSVFAVGDDDQSIYAFRGAQVSNMADFEREFRVAKVVKLEQNYRSHGHILDAANTLIAQNSQRLGKNLRTDEGLGEPIRIFEAASDYAEAQWVVDEARQFKREGQPLHEVAVLYRSNAQSRVIESALFNAGVPYKVYGGLRFFERAEVKHALAYLRLIENPNDDTSFLRVVNFPTRGIGARSVELVQDAARTSGRSLTQSVTAIPGKTGANLQGFVALVDAMREATRGLTLRQIIEHVLETSGLREFYRNEKEGQDRLENLDELVNAAEAFVTQEGFGKDAVALPVDEPAGMIAVGLPAVVASVDMLPDAETGEIISPLLAFLTHASLEAGDNQAQAGQDAVQLMTIHASKGLEFNNVFLTGLEEGLFPHENSATSTEGLEEERRLMYVAITRARRRLHISFCQTRMLHGQTRYNIKSRFLDELPEGALKWLTPRNQGFGSGFAASYQDAWSSGKGMGSVVGAGAQPWRGGGASGAAGGSRGGYGGQAQGGYGKREESFKDLTAPIPKAMAQAKSEAGFKVGQSVFHNKFGEGVILTLEGNGADARVQVNFGRHGTKWLMLSVAKLTPIE